MLCRAPHIVQRFFLADNPITAALPGRRRSARIVDMGTRVDNTRGRYILMDHCRFGTLRSQLFKAAVDQDPNNTERWLPDSVLWRIFDCLIKACMAMECPPRYVPANGPQAPAPAAGAAPAVPPWTTSLSAGYLPEVVAPGNGINAGHYGIVHGDLVCRIFVASNHPAHSYSFLKILPNSLHEPASRTNPHPIFLFCGEREGCGPSRPRPPPLSPNRPLPSSSRTF